jgi:hypothetical protein
MPHPQIRPIKTNRGDETKMNLSEQYAEKLNDLLYVLKIAKVAGGMIEGVPALSLFNFAKSEIQGLQVGFQTKDECMWCSDCCILPLAIIPLQGPDGGLIRPLKYGLKHRNQPCWWLRKTDEGFKCALHDTKEKPYTCFAYQCESRIKLKEIMDNAEKGGK